MFQLLQNMLGRILSCFLCSPNFCFLQVTGFSVSGRVLNDKGEGIPGAKVVIDGADGGVTSADGRYSIDKVRGVGERATAPKQELVVPTAKHGPSFAHVLIRISWRLGTQNFEYVHPFGSSCLPINSL
jgi:hypothetical protein